MPMTQYTTWEFIPKMTFLTRLDRVLERVFDTLPYKAVVGVASVLLGVTNIIDRNSGMARVMRSDYHISNELNAVFMLLLIVAGAALLLRRQPARIWYVPAAIYAVVTPLAIMASAITSNNPNTLWFGLKTFASTGLLAGYTLIRLVRQGDDE